MLKNNLAKLRGDRTQARDCINALEIAAPKWCAEFARLWDSTIKPADLPTCGWAANPWVWVINFERAEAQKERAERE